MYRIIGILLMIIGTFLLIILGAMVLIWAEIIHRPNENLNEAAPERLPADIPTHTSDILLAEEW